MPTTTDYRNAIPSFIADHGSTAKRPGVNIKWSAVNDSFKDAETGKKRFKAGQLMSILSDGQMIEYGGTDASASPDETPTVAHGLLASEAVEDAPAESMSGHGLYVRGIVYENLLPDASGGPPKVLSAGEKTALADGDCLFQFITYKDSRAD